MDVGSIRGAPRHLVGGRRRGRLGELAGLPLLQMKMVSGGTWATPPTISLAKWHAAPCMRARTSLSRRRTHAVTSGRGRHRGESCSPRPSPLVLRQLWRLRREPGGVHSAPRFLSELCFESGLCFLGEVFQRVVVNASSSCQSAIEPDLHVLASQDYAG